MPNNRDNRVTLDLEITGASIVLDVTDGGSLVLPSPPWHIAHDDLGRPSMTVSGTGAMAMVNIWGPQVTVGRVWYDDDVYQLDAPRTSVPAGTVSQLDNHIMRAYMLYYQAGGRAQWSTLST